VRHWHHDPAPTTFKFADGAVFMRTPKGLKAVIEVTAYPPGHVAISRSQVTGKPRSRTITQVGEPLMFNDMDEAKDAIDLIVDRLAREAGSLDQAEPEAP
jgi:hypothetical protein